MRHMVLYLNYHTRCIITLTLTMFSKLRWKLILWCATLLSEHVIVWKTSALLFHSLPTWLWGFSLHSMFSKCLWSNQIPRCCWTELIAEKVFLTFTRNHSSLLTLSFFFPSLYCSTTFLCPFFFSSAHFSFLSFFSKTCLYSFLSAVGVQSTQNSIAAFWFLLSLSVSSHPTLSLLQSCRKLQVEEIFDLWEEINVSVDTDECSTAPAA